MTAWATLLGFCSLRGLAPSRPSPAAPAVAAGAATPLRPWAAATASLDATASATAAPEVGHGLSMLGVGALCAAAWRRARGGRGGSGRVVVRGRNFETNIRKKKGPADLLKVKVAGKHLTKIIVACREAGTDESTNPQLKRAIKSALKDNVSRATIDGRIKKFLDAKEAIMDFTCSGMVSGAALIVECVTNNTTRLRRDVREAFKAAGSEIGSSGCCDHLFDRRGVITFKDVDEETVVEAAMEAEVEDCEAKDDGSVEVLTLPENFHSSIEALETQDLEAASSEVKYLPHMEVQLNDAQTYDVKWVIHLLEDIEDVQEIHHNAIFTDQELDLDNYGRPKKFKAKA